MNKNSIIFQKDSGSPKRPIYSMTLCAVMTALIAIAAPLSIPLPISPVPVTLATLALMISSCILGWKLGAVSCLLYLSLGLIGLPVFAGYSSGLADLIGPTGGYLAGYLPLCILTGLIFRSVKSPLSQALLLCAANLLAVYLPGTIWLAWQAGLTATQALLMGLVPYIPGDLAKIIITVSIGPAIRQRLWQAGLDT